MKKDIILSGVGGQGILSIATVIGQAALKDGLYMKQAEVHGMSQRGGDVQSNLRISDQPISSDLIPTGKCVNEIAKEVGSPRVANIVLLGATIPFLGIDYQKVRDSIRDIFQRKGEAIVELNLKALAAGKEIAENLM